MPRVSEGLMMSETFDRSMQKSIPALIAGVGHALTTSEITVGLGLMYGLDMARLAVEVSETSHHPDRAFYQAVADYLEGCCGTYAQMIALMRAEGFVTPDAEDDQDEGTDGE